MTDQNPQNPKKGHKRDYRVAIIVGVLLLAAGYGIASVVGGAEAPRKRVMDTVAIKILPPPPPPKTDPPPPPPKLVEKPKIQPPIDKPVETPKPADEPPPGPLALDAKGGAGSDSFGLGGKPGGSDFFSGGGTKYGHYSALARDNIKRLLGESEKLAGAKYHGEIFVWFNPSGGVARLEMRHFRGDADANGVIQEIISTKLALPEAPPADMQQMILRVDSNMNDGT